MSGYRFVFIQAGSGSAPQAIPAPVAQAAPDVAPAPSLPARDQLREQIRQTIQEATQGARDAREMQQEIRNAQQHVRDAEQQIKSAKTADQRVAAEQELFGARAELNALQGAQQVLVHTVQPTTLPRDMIPPQAVDISVAFFVMLAVIIIGWPLARAFGRRLERRAEAPTIADPGIAVQLQRIEQAVEAMSIEIERISESQRFMAKLQNGAATERAALGSAEHR